MLWVRGEPKGYAPDDRRPRNVQEALGQLRAADVLHSSTLGNEQRFQTPRRRWTEFLGLEELPSHRDWPQLSAAYRRLLRWVVAHETAWLSPYMVASEARLLAEELSSDLRFAGERLMPAGRGVRITGTRSPSGVIARPQKPALYTVFCGLGEVARSHMGVLPKPFGSGSRTRF